MVKLKLQPTKHQEAAIEYMAANPYCVVALPPGKGKTLCAISMKVKYPKARILVVCPAYLIYNWKNEIAKSIEGVFVDVIDAPEKMIYPIDADFVIISYDRAKKFNELFKWCNIVVFDEATALKNMESQITDAMHRSVYENGISRCYLLTGTPIKNRVIEFYSLIAICNYNPRLPEPIFLNKYPEPVTFAEEFSHKEEFYMSYFKYGREMQFPVVKWTGIKNEEGLAKILNGIYIAVLPDYKPVNYLSKIVLDQDEEDLLEDFVRESTRPEHRRASAIRKAPQTLKYVKNLLDSGEADCVVVFSDFVEPVKLIAKGLNVSAITGEMPAKNRQKLVDDFQAGKINAIVGTIGAMSTGVTLVRSQHLIFNDYPWVPGDKIQAEHRINRMGQKRPVFIHHMLGSEQDEKILEVIREKQKVLEKVQVL